MTATSSEYSQRKRVCQYDEAAISCDSGKSIRVLEASYGRFDTFPCGNPTVPPTNTEEMCGEANNVQTKIQSQCDGKQQCAIEAVAPLLNQPNRERADTGVCAETVTRKVT